MCNIFCMFQAGQMGEIDETLADILTQLKVKDKEKVRAKVTEANRMCNLYGWSLQDSIALYPD